MQSNIGLLHIAEQQEELGIKIIIIQIVRPKIK